MIKKLQNIYRIIPEEFQKKSLRHILLSVFNIFLDLVSIAYLIPLFIFILDKDQMPEFLKKITFFNQDYLGFWIGGIILLFIIKNLIQITIIKFQSVLVFDIATKLSGNLATRFLQQSYLNIQQLDKGKEIQKIQMSGTDFSNHILLSLNTFFTEITMMLLIAMVSFILYPKLSIFIFAITIICLLVLYKFRKKKIDTIGKSIRQSYSKATSHLLNIIDGFLEIKSLHKEAFFQKKYAETLSQFNDNFAILKKHQNSNSKYLEIFIIIGLSLFLFYLNTNITVASSKVLLISYVAGISLKLFPSLNKLIIAYTNFKSYRYTIDVLTSQPQNNADVVNSNSFKQTISLEDVSFSYSKKEPLLTSLNLKLNKGEIIGIKGRSGIGKTTLLNIIMGLISVDNGKLLIDNRQITNSSSLFPFVGYVPQQPFLFQGTLLENIVMDETENSIDYKKIERLITDFGLQKLIARLPNGLNTKISHDSLQLSGGQKQRIALIRVLYAKPQLLILDEVTNQLDEELEITILQFLKTYAKEQHIAILIASHSPAINAICDTTFTITNHSLVAN